jgi:hypothetical protein
MERPKSAKYNIERVKKSSNYLGTSKPTNITNHNNPTLRNKTKNNNDSDSNQYNVVVDRSQISKSAYITRPQSARHNLDKYRQDVMIERQRKLNLITQLDHLNNNNNNNDNNTQNNNIYDLLMDEDDLDKMDTLLINEAPDSSGNTSGAESSDADSNHSYSINHSNLVNTKLQKLKPINNNQINKKFSNTNNKINKNSKLLSKRNTGVVVGMGGLNDPEAPINHSTSSLGSQQQQQQLFTNKSVKINQYTTFRPTAVTTSYSTSPLIHHHHHNNNPPSLNNNQLLVINNFNEQMSDTNINSSSSSTSTNSSSSVKQQQHLNENTKKELLKEWLKNDDEVELEIASFDPTNTTSTAYQKPFLRPKNNNIAVNSASMLSKGSFNSSVSSSGHGGRVPSGYSDLANSFNTSNSNSSSNNNTALLMTTTKERSMNLIDPWTKRNPHLVAQNVLLKHKAELDQFRTAATAAATNSNSSYSRATNNTSQISNISTSILYHNNHNNSSSLGMYQNNNNKFYNTNNKKS